MPSTRHDPTVACPVCGKNAVYSADNPFRPFCSERCRLTDLGAWAAEAYRIPEVRPADDEGEPDENETQKP